MRRFVDSVPSITRNFPECTWTETLRFLTMPSMNTVQWRRISAAVVWLLASGYAAASGQYVVQPGAAAGPRTCAAEVWHSDPGEANLANITCRADAPFHVTMEAGIPESGPESYVFEGHYQLRAYDRTGYDLGLFAGASYGSGPGEITESMFLVPVTFRPIQDRLSVHVNLGAVHSHQVDDTEAFWGAAAEFQLVGPVTVVAETFGTNGNDPAVHAGIRLTFLDGRLSLDASYLDEREDGGGEGWAAGAAFQVATF